MNRRLNISLPEETIRTIDMVIQDGEFSGDIIGDRFAFVNEAIPIKSVNITASMITSSSYSLKSGDGIILNSIIHLRTDLSPS